MYLAACAAAHWSAAQTRPPRHRHSVLARPTAARWRRRKVGPPDPFHGHRPAAGQGAARTATRSEHTGTTAHQPHSTRTGPRHDVRALCGLKGRPAPPPARDKALAGRRRRQIKSKGQEQEQEQGQDQGQRRRSKAKVKGEGQGQEHTEPSGHSSPGFPLRSPRTPSLSPPVPARGPARGAHPTHMTAGTTLARTITSTGRNHSPGRQEGSKRGTPCPRPCTRKGTADTAAPPQRCGLRPASAQVELAVPDPGSKGGPLSGGEGQHRPALVL
jgi:hypothetical protein